VCREERQAAALCSVVWLMTSPLYREARVA
jgi:hypothetical protein